MSIREIKEAARREIHGAFAYPALYYPPGVTDPNSAVPCNVRVQEYAVKPIGDVEYQTFPERGVIENPILTFLVSEVSPARGGKVVFDDGGETYYVNTVDPVYNLTVTAHVERESP